MNANLRNTHITFTTVLRGAKVWPADLRGTRMTRAEFELTGALFDAGI